MRMLHKIYIYREKENLPEEGWFQSCYMCDTITSGLELFDTWEEGKKTYEIHVYLCSGCHKKITYNVPFHDSYKRRCSRYIDKHFFTYPLIQIPRSPALS